MDHLNEYNTSETKEFFVEDSTYANNQTIKLSSLLNQAKPTLSQELYP